MLTSRMVPATCFAAPGAAIEDSGRRTGASARGLSTRLRVAIKPRGRSRAQLPPLHTHDDSSAAAGTCLQPAAQERRAALLHSAQEVQQEEERRCRVHAAWVAAPVAPLALALVRWQTTLKLP